MSAPTLTARRRAAVRRALDTAPAKPADYAAFAARRNFPSPDKLKSAAALFNPVQHWPGGIGGWRRPVAEAPERPVTRLGIAAGAISLNRRNYARAEKSAERRRQRHEKAARDLAVWFATYGEMPGAECLCGHLQSRHTSGQGPCAGQFDPDADDGAPGCACVAFQAALVRNNKSSREVRQFSRKSRANMCLALCQLDYTVLFEDNGKPAMVTLTYPGDWLTVARTGHDLRRHLAMFRRAYERAWRRKLVAVWKKEFQRRGAPHVHMLMCPPRGRARRGRFAGMPFPEWLSHMWAAIVDHPDPVEYDNHVRAGTGVDYREGLRAYDPKRLAVYFLKHGLFTAKDYQNTVPAEWQGPGDGPGRFWGYWRMKRVVARVELADDQAPKAARLMRKWARAQGPARTSRGDVAKFPAEWQTRYENGHARQHAKGCQTWRCSCEVSRAPYAPVVNRGSLRARGGLMRPRDREIIGLSGAQELLAQPPPRRRRVRRRVDRMKGGAGWISVNDGFLFAHLIARALWDPVPSPAHI